MKLRIRYDLQKCLIQLGDNVKTINDLKDVISTELQNLPAEYSLSLNGLTGLDEEGGGRLIVDAGIISGDLVHVIQLQGKTGNVKVSTQPGLETNASSSLCSVKNEKKQDICKLLPSTITSSSSLSSLSTTEMDVDQQDNKHVPSVHQTSSSSSVMMTSCDDNDFMSGNSDDLMTPKFKRLPPSPQRSLGFVVHCFMTELGFKPRVCEDRVSMEEMLSDDDDDDDINAIEMKWQHLGFDNMTFHTLLITMMNKSILHGSSSYNGEVVGKYSLNIDSSHIFGVGFNHDHPMNALKKDQIVIFKKQFKDAVGNNLIQSALRAHGYRLMAELSTIPFEVQLKILDLLDVPSLLRLSETSKLWRSLSLDPSTWKMKYMRLLRSDSNLKAKTLNPNPDWLELYKESYTTAKKRSDRMRDKRHDPFRHQPYPPPFFQGHNPFALPPPHYPLPGVIGGRYDIIPGGFPDLNPNFPHEFYPNYDIGGENFIPGPPNRGHKGRGARKGFPGFPGRKDWF